MKLGGASHSDAHAKILLLAKIAAATTNANDDGAILLEPDVLQQSLLKTLSRFCLHVLKMSSRSSNGY